MSKVTPLSKQDEEQAASKSDKLKSGKGKFRRSPKPGEDSNRFDYTKGHNDIKWLMYNPKLSDIAARVPFGSPTGAATRLFDIADSTATNPRRLDGHHIVGILKVNAILTGGYSADINSDINVVGRNIWTKLRAAGTGAVVNDPCDLIATLIAEGQLVLAYGMLRRLVDVLYHYNSQNKYASRAIVQAMGFDYDDLVSHLAELVYFTNYVGNKINNFIMPNIPYFDQAYEMCRHIYVDQALKKGQYMFVNPYVFGKIAYFRDEEEGTQIRYYDLATASEDPEDWGTGGLATLQKIKDFVEQLFAPLLSEEYVMTLNAALLKAYKDDLWVIKDLSVDVPDLLVAVDAEFIMQLHNMEWSGYSLISNVNNEFIFNYKSVTPPMGDGSIPYLVNYTSEVPYSDKFPENGTSGQDKYILRKHYFDMFTDEPSGAEVILASRWKLNFSTNVGAKNATVLVSSDVIVPVNVYTYFFVTETNTGNVSLYEEILPSNFAGSLAYVTATDPLRTRFMNGVRVHAFTGSPLTFTYWATGNAAAIHPEIMGDTHNFTIVDDSVIRDIHRANVLSLFKVPFEG